MTALLLKKYGIDTQQWLKMYMRQGGKCPICLKAIYKPGNPYRRRAANVDHDHKTKRVRGLTCHFCNRYRIGTNNVETASRVLAYLQSEFDGRGI